jgi:phosphatidylserine/phosphatidylglycerophosphate/cardiolipin synthase-like enzyme
MTNFIGKDFSNPRIKDFIDVHQAEKDLIDRTKCPRMPWHDVHCRLEGQPARDVARHFIQRWNYSIATRSKKEKMHPLIPKKDYSCGSGNGSDGSSSSSSSCGFFFMEKKKQEETKQKMNRRLKKAVHTVRLFHDLQRKTTFSASTNDLLTPPSSPVFSPPPSLLPSPSSSSLSPTTTTTTFPSMYCRGFDQGRRLSRVLSPQVSFQLPTLNDSTEEKVKERIFQEEEEKKEKEKEKEEKRGLPCHVQVLRSLSLWSGGCTTEKSIQNAYLRLISTSQHFIYIENQFFVSGMEGDSFVSNRIANAIVERIRRAALNKEKFRVMIIMPLLPAFPGKIEEKDATSLRGVMYWQYRSICRGEHSMYHHLFEELEDPFEYLAFYGLRTHQIHENKPYTEEIYVHSKTMIIDDRHVIIGSANINERSMNGDRDSEIAVVIEDVEHLEEVKLADGALCVGRFAHSFRMKLFEEHFGQEMYLQYLDPVNIDTWFTMQDQAMKNYQIYENVFGCLPSDNILTFKQLGFNEQQQKDNLIPSGKGIFKVKSKQDVILPPTNTATATATAITRTHDNATDATGNDSGNGNGNGNGGDSISASASASASGSDSPSKVTFGKGNSLTPIQRNGTKNSPGKSACIGGRSSRFGFENSNMPSLRTAKRTTCQLSKFQTAESSDGSLLEKTKSSPMANTDTTTVTTTNSSSTQSQKNTTATASVISSATLTSTNSSDVLLSESINTIDTPMENRSSAILAPSITLIEQSNESDPSVLIGDAMTFNRCEDDVIVQRREELNDIKGHIVYFPLKFLSEEMLEPKLYPVELFQ